MGGFLQKEWAHCHEKWLCLDCRQKSSRQGSHGNRDIMLDDFWISIHCKDSPFYVLNICECLFMETKQKILIVLLIISTSWDSYI